MSRKAQENFIRMEIRGIAKDAHEKFPIKFDYAANGIAYFTGCNVQVTFQGENGNSFTQKMDVQAFREVAEELASVSDGCLVHLKGSYGKKKAKDGKYYDVMTVDEIISID